MTAPARTVIHSAQLVSGGTVATDSWVAFDGATITAVGTGTVDAAILDAAGGSVIDAHGAWLLPGFIDIHCHGGGGSSFEDGTDAIGTALAMHRSHGTTRSVLSLVTASIDELERRLATVAELADRDPLVLGAHLEGPFLASARKGAHDPALLRQADPDTLDRLLAAAGGRLSQVTLAPELPHGMDALGYFVDAGVAVAIGHTGADYAQASAAFDAGASILTHAFNAMPGLHHREPGPVAAAIRAESVVLEIINDGVHLHPDIVGLAFAAAGGRVAMITDAMAAAGSGDGEYRLGTQSITVGAGVARLTHGDSIAGSTLTQDAALRRAIRAVGLPIEAAALAVTETPARAIGRAHDLGRLQAGYAADAVLLDEELAVTAVWAEGRRMR